MPATPAGAQHGDRGADDDERARNQHDEARHLHLVRFDLLAEIFRRAADHEPGDEHRDDREREHSVEARADAAEDDFAELHQPHRHEAAERRERVVHRVDRAVRRGGRRGRPERRVDDAEARLPCLPCCRRPAAADAIDRRRARAAPDCRLVRRPCTRAAAARRSRASSRAAPSPGGGRRPSRRTCSRARPGSAGSTSTSRKLLSGVGFSYGCAELAL